MTKPRMRWALVDDARKKLPEYPWFATFGEATAFRQANNLRNRVFIYREDYVRV